MMVALKRVWVSRKVKRGQALDLSDLVPLDADPEGPASSRAPPLVGAVAPDAFPFTSPYPIADNRRGHIYHRPNRPNYGQIAAHNRIAFVNEAEAKEGEYRLARNCP